MHPFHKWLPIFLKIILYEFKLAWLNSFESKIPLNYQLQNEVSKAHFITCKGIYNSVKAIYRKDSLTNPLARIQVLSSWLSLRTGFRARRIFFPSSPGACSQAIDG